MCVCVCACAHGSKAAFFFFRLLNPPSAIFWTTGTTAPSLSSLAAAGAVVYSSFSFSSLVAPRTSCSFCLPKYPRTPLLSCNSLC